jgi:hypothetical protein
MYISEHIARTNWQQPQLTEIDHSRSEGQDSSPTGHHRVRGLPSAHSEVDIDYQYAFVHDKIREACYEMTTDDQLVTTHLIIGRNMKEYSIQSDEVLFAICNHIGPSSYLLNDEERHEMVLMNLRAARKAMARAAFEYALRYSLAARSLSKELDLKVDTMDRLGIDQVLLQALFSLAMYDDVLKETKTMLASTSTDLASLVIGVERIRALRSVGRNAEAYELGMKAIQSLGLLIPDDIFDPDEIMSLSTQYRKSLDTEEALKV